MIEIMGETADECGEDVERLGIVFEIGEFVGTVEELEYCEGMCEVMIGEYVVIEVDFKNE